MMPGAASRWRRDFDYCIRIWGGKVRWPDAVAGQCAPWREAGAGISNSGDCDFLPSIEWDRSRYPSTSGYTPVSTGCDACTRSATRRWRERSNGVALRWYFACLRARMTCLSAVDRENSPHGSINRNVACDGHGDRCGRGEGRNPAHQWRSSTYVARLDSITAFGMGHADACIATGCARRLRDRLAHPLHVHMAVPWVVRATRLDIATNRGGRRFPRFYHARFSFIDNGIGGAV